MNDIHDFVSICDRVIEREGGWVDHHDPNDPGGRTFAGIASATFDQEYFPWDGLDEYGPDDSGVRHAAREVYHEHFWEPLKCDDMPVGVAECVFDMAVNIGAPAAAKIVQDAVGTTPDGIIGDITLAAMKAHPSLRAGVRITNKRLEFYDEVIKNRPASHIYRDGWRWRALHVLATAWFVHKEEEHSQ